MKPIVVTSGEPAGIGPDICLSLANRQLPIVVVGDIDILQERARKLNIKINLKEYNPQYKLNFTDGLYVLHTTCKKHVVPGVLNQANSYYVMQTLEIAAKATLNGEFAALVTAPVHKGIINAAGITFSGHTEFFAEICNVEKVVMMLASPIMRVALLTTHIPISQVSKAVNEKNLITTINILNNSLKQNYAISDPKIYISGLNPHAGENGYIGHEDVEIIEPTIKMLRSQGLNLVGPLSADTMFKENNLVQADAFLVMYHDQGLPVLKYSGFNDSINITLGLPIVRTSVDHGTALNLAGSGNANSQSLNLAVTEAIRMAIYQNL